MQCADLPMPSVVHAQEVELIVHVVARSVFLVPFPLLLVVPTCETGAGDSVVACPCKEAFARVSWLPSFGYFLWAPFL